MRFRRYFVGFEDNRGEYVASFVFKCRALRWAKQASNAGTAVVVQRRRHGVTHVLASYPWDLR
jgi:hypothetical protein